MEEKAVEGANGVFDIDVVDGVVAAFVVGGVADDGVIYRGEVDADLMRPAGLDGDLEQCEFLKPLPDLPY